jgi:hypothetical protein
MILPGNKNDFKDIFDIINDAALAYKGIIPAGQMARTLYVGARTAGSN